MFTDFAKGRTHVSTITARLGTTIRQVRSKRGLTQREAAQRAGLSGSYWALIEQGKRDPSLQIVERIGESLGLPLSLLVFLASDLNDLESVDRSIAERLALLSWKLLEEPKSAAESSV